MTRDVNRERLERLRGDLAELRARAAADGLVEQGPAQDQRTADDEDPDATPVVGLRVAEPAAAPPQARDDDGWSVRLSRQDQTSDDGGRKVSVNGTTAPRGLRRRRGIPRPPRRNPFRRRAHRPPDRLAVPAPVPVPRRPRWMAAPRWPTITVVSGLVITLVMVPVAAQLAFRLLTAMEETSFLLGADPSRADQLRAAAGVAGGGITTALAVAALGIVRGRVGYVVGAVAVLLLFVVFPYLAYTANAGIVAAPIPTLEQMLAPQGWERAGQLRLVFWLSAGAFVAALADLLYRSATAVRNGLQAQEE